MTQPLPTQPAEVLDVFEGTAHLVIELHNAIAGARCVVVEITGAQTKRNLDGMNRAHTELEKLLGQSRLLSESLGRVIQFHTNRRKAQS